MRSACGPTKTTGKHVETPDPLQQCHEEKDLRKLARLSRVSKACYTLEAGNGAVCAIVKRLYMGYGHPSQNAKPNIMGM